MEGDSVKPDLSQYPKLTDKVLGDLLRIKDNIEHMVHHDMHEDINEYLLDPIYHVLRSNGVNLEEQDY